MHLKIPSAKWRPFCPGGDKLIDALIDAVSVLTIADYRVKSDNFTLRKNS